MAKPSLARATLFTLFLAACTDSPSSPNRPSPLIQSSQSQLPGISSSITFVSDATWSAQHVCLNPLAPSNCPAGALLYGVGGLGAGWNADLSVIPGAMWIWADGITAETSPAYPAEFVFSKTFNLLGAPIAGTISVAVDDFAEVVVNGTVVGTVGSVSDGSLAGPAQNALTTFNIAPYLVTGSNVVAVRAANGVFGCGSGAYACNPAGVVFGGEMVSADAAYLIELLSGAVLDLDLAPSGIATSLVAKLTAARKSAGRGDVAAACASLRAFVQHVQAQTGKAISAVDAVRFSEAVDQIADLLACT